MFWNCITSITAYASYRVELQYPIADPPLYVVKVNGEVCAVDLSEDAARAWCVRDDAEKRAAGPPPVW